MEKWLINLEKKKDRNNEQEMGNWNNNYQKYQYDDVFSITEDRDVCKKLASGIKENSNKILIPGCGSKTYLQDYISTIFDGDIICTDWSKHALEIAKESSKSDKICYFKDDMTNMQFDDNTFDNIIISNSILSGDDRNNRKMLNECNRVLKKGGTLTGLFPSVYATYEISYLDEQFKYLRKENIISIEDNTFYETTQDMYQIFYTPIRLRRIFKENNFKTEKFEIFFCDSEHLLEENEKIYKLPKESDLVIWEFFIELTKVSKFG